MRKDLCFIEPTTAGGLLHKKIPFFVNHATFEFIFVGKQLLETRHSKLICGNLLVVYYKRIKVGTVLVFVIKCF